MTKTVQKPTIGLGILSWKGYGSLAHMLDSLSVPGFLDLFDEKMIFFPEIDDKGVRLAADYSVSCTGSPANLGIYGGFRALAESMTADIVLLLENDLHLIESVETARREIETATALLANGTVQVVHIRSRRDPGEPFSGLIKYRRYHPAIDASAITKLTAALRRTLRPAKAHRLSGHAPYAEVAPQQRFPDINHDAQTGFLTMPTSIRGWTNQPFMIDRRFYLDTILARVETVDSTRRVNGFKNIEIELNGPWWRQQDWTIAVAPGLFRHERFEDRGY